MSAEFTLTPDRTIVSDKGFSVVVLFSGGVIYREGNYEVRINSEWLARPHGIVLYRKTQGQIDARDADRIFDNLKRALEFSNHPVEVWLDGKPPMPDFDKL